MLPGICSSQYSWPQWKSICPIPASFHQNIRTFITESPSILWRDFRSTLYYQSIGGVKWSFLSPPLPNTPPPLPPSSLLLTYSPIDILLGIFRFLFRINWHCVSGDKGSIDGSCWSKSKGKPSSSVRAASRTWFIFIAKGNSWPVFDENKEL